MSANPDVLRRALDRLRLHGMAKTTLHDEETGAVCANGAVNCARRGHYHYAAFGNPEVTLLAQIAEQQFPDRAVLSDFAVAAHRGFEAEHLVAEFNNHKDTTQDDVELVFEKAIIRAGGCL